MATTSYNDLAVVHRYLDEITTFIQGIVQKESVAIVLACQVFEEHKKLQDAVPFPSEEDRGLWLRLKARSVAITYLQTKSDEEQKQKAVKKAIHNYS